MVARSVALIVAAALVATWPAISAGPDRSATARPGSAPADPRRSDGPGEQNSPADQVARPFRGVALQITWAENAVPRYAPAIHEIASLGADTLLLSISVYQTHGGTTSIYADPQRTPSDDDLQFLCALARARGLRVVLMPKILLARPRGNEWRGRIRPTSWDEWWDSYTRVIVHYARLSTEAGVEVLIVGSELISAERFEQRWRDLIAQVRAVYPGLLAYSANWDHYSAVPFWDALDLVGVTTYNKLSDDPLPTVEQLEAAWRPVRQRLFEWQSRIARPILLTEVGWASQEGCSIEAWNYYRSSRATPAGLEEQRRCYEAFVRAWPLEPPLAGVIWWEWSPEPCGPQDVSYCPRGKPAEAVLRAWFDMTGRLVGGGAGAGWSARGVGAPTNAARGR